MKTLKCIYLLFLICLLEMPCLGQVDTLNLTKSGVYDKKIDFMEVSVNIKRFRSFSEFIFNNEVSFFSSNIVNDADFSRSIFRKDVDFAEAIFYENVEFQYSTFNSNARFSEAKLEKNTTFFSSIFQENVNFGSAIFMNNTDFSNAIFRGNSNFSNTLFSKGLIFLEATIIKNIDFSNSNFFIKADFSSLKGNGKIIFEETQMPNLINFSKVDSIKTDFRDVKIDLLSNLNFKVIENGVREKTENKRYIVIESNGLLDTLFFSDHAIIHGLINNDNDFNLIQLSQKLKKCVIQLKGTSLENVILPFDRFWADTTGYTYEEKTALYEKLIKKCKEEGMDDSVQGWDIELKKLQTLHNWQKTGHFLNRFQSIFWNYSYAKWYILLWITGLYLLFSLLNFFIYPNLLRVYFNPKLGFNLFTSPFESVEFLIRTLQNDASIRLRYVLHFTGVIFFGLKLEHSDMNFKKLRWVIVLYFQFIIGLLLLGFALNFVLSK